MIVLFKYLKGCHDMKVVLYGETFWSIHNTTIIALQFHFSYEKSQEFIEHFGGYDNWT